MSPNMSNVDRLARALIGVVIIAYSLPRGVDHATWHLFGILGAFVLLTAVIANCPLYAMFRPSSHDGSPVPGAPVRR